MSWLDSKDKKDSKKFENLKNKIRQEGISKCVDQKFYTKLVVEQNQIIIELLAEMVRTNRQLIAPELQVVKEPFDITNKYYDNVLRILESK
jgi:hypothetical protein